MWPPKNYKNLDINQGHNLPFPRQLSPGLKRIYRKGSRESLDSTISPSRGLQGPVLDSLHQTAKAAKKLLNSWAETAPTRCVVQRSHTRWALAVNSLVQFGLEKRQNGLQPSILIFPLSNEESSHGNTACHSQQLGQHLPGHVPRPRAGPRVL